jgi:hypothetical protein
VADMSGSGRCECGGVRYRVDGPLRDVSNCHCYRCRRFTGHHMAASGAPLASVTFDADATLKWYSPDPTVAYGFCSVCGSSLFWKAQSSPDHLVICAGTLDQPTGLKTTAAWWVAEMGDYHQRPAGLTEYDYDA